jgi:glycosyltransferase involved in cell wall biosynthesis
MMKVAYDISVLGLGHQLPYARTGVFRVVENLAYGLKNSTECNLFFCTSESLTSLFDALDYLELKSEFANIPIPHKKRKLRRNFYTLLSQAELKLNNYLDPPTFLIRAWKKVFKYVNDGTELFRNPIEFKELLNSDIYHSPFGQIPPQIREKKSINKFTTIYDLIPILYPNFYKFKKQDNTIKSILNLNEESWVICISKATKNDLCNHSRSINPERVFTTYLAASDCFYPCFDAKKIQLTQRKHRIPDAPYILSLSTLEPRKNIPHAIRCFMKLIQQENLPDLNLVLVGTKGWNYNEIFSEVQSHPTLKNRVIVTGYVSDEDLAPLYSGALAFVYPSFYEGFGLPPLEAMQCGVPVITSNTSSLPEVVGDAGLMVDPKDSDGLCQGIIDLYKQPSLRESMSQKSLIQAQKFSWENCTKQTVAAYKTAVSS